jgi:hypothetical protein
MENRGEAERIRLPDAQSVYWRLIPPARPEGACSVQ